MIGLSVCVCRSVNSISESDERISLKLGVGIGPSNRKNWLSFGEAVIPDIYFRSLYHFSHLCGIGDFSRFISISHTVSAQFLRCLPK